MFSINSFGQSEGDFRSRQTGNWNDSDTWEEFTSGSWTNTANTPDNADGTITVLSTHTITITASVTIDETTIDSGGTVEIQEANTLTVADGAGDDLTINGTLTLLDDFFSSGSTLTVNGQVANTGSISITDPNLSSINFNAGSAYAHNQSGGAVPEASWNATSTVTIDIGSSSTAPSNLDQTFGNFTWDSSQSSTTNLSLSGSTTIIQGDFTVSNTGGRILVLSTGTATLQVNGDVIVSGLTNLALTSIGTVTLNVDGNYTSTSSRSSLLASSGTGTLNVDGDFEFSDGDLEGNSNSEINFSGGTTQALICGGEFVTVNFDINSGSTVTATLSGSTSPVFTDLTVTGTFTPNLDYQINGDLTVDGTFNAGTGNVTFGGSSAQSLGGSSAITFNDMTVTNSSGVSVTGTVNLLGLFTLGGSGVFDADGGGSGVFVVQSNGITDDDAAIGDLTGITGNFTGDVTVQRYVDGPDDWRYISSPITDGDLGMWRDDFSITGNFSDATTPGEDPNVISASAPSVYFYDASTDAWSAVDGGGNATSTVALTNGTGYSAYIYDPSDFTFAVRGSIGKGAVNISLTADGSGRFNLVGNPYPAAIDWDNIDQTGLSSTMSIRTANNTFATWNGSVATNAPFGGWEGEIAMGQSFWVQSTSATTLTINEDDKTINQNHFLREASPENYVRIKLLNSTQADEAIVMFAADATDELDFQYDAIKRKNGSYNSSEYSYLNLSTYFDADPQDFTINVMPYAKCSKTVSLKVADVSTGTHQLYFSDLSTFNLPYNITLIDNYLNKTFEVLDNSLYGFEVTSDPLTYGEDRFDLVFEATPVDIETTVSLDSDKLCTDENAIIRIENSELTSEYRLFKDGVVYGEPIAGDGGTVAFAVGAEDLSVGENHFAIEVAKSGCEPVYLLTEPIANVMVPIDIQQVQNGIGCFGEEVSLNAEAENVQSYNWYAFDTDETPIATTTDGVFTTTSLSKTTTYYVAAVNSAGCLGPKTPVIAEIAKANLPKVVNGMSCDEGKVALEASGANANDFYLWYESQSDVEPVEINTTGFYETPAISSSRNYFVAIRNEHDCESDRVSVEAKIVDIQVPVVTADGNVFTSSSVSGNQWFKDDEPIPGATSQNLTVTESGSYKVMVSEGGCLKTSESQMFTVAGIVKAVPEFSIYPNPIEDKIHISNKNGATITDIELVDNVGKVIYTIKNLTISKSYTIEIPEVGKGIYILNIATNKGVASYRLLKQ